MAKGITLERYRGQGLRSLSSFDLQPGAGLNWVFGDNAAGKTTVLEGIYILSRGRSFRRRRFGPVVARGRSHAELSAWAKRDGRPIRLDWRSAPGGMGHAARTGMPVRLVGDRAFELLEGEPGLRRRFIDLNLFYVEQSYAEQLSRFRKIADQRNHWLRLGAEGARVWDSLYAEAHTCIDQARQGLVLEIAAELRMLALEVLGRTGLSLCWRSSVPAGSDALRALIDSFQIDRQRGFTSTGPSRSDFWVEQDGRKWLGSRGENKMLVFLIQLAAALVTERRTADRPVWLLDDLSAELSGFNQDRVYACLSARRYQAFVTSLEEPGIRQRRFDGQVFHVKHGSIVPRPATDRLNDTTP